MLSDGYCPRFEIPLPILHFQNNASRYFVVIEVADLYLGVCSLHCHVNKAKQGDGEQYLVRSLTFSLREIAPNRR